MADWVAMGYRRGQLKEEGDVVDSWSSHANTHIDGDALIVEKGKVRHKLKQTMTWRFEARWTATVQERSVVEFILGNGTKRGVVVGFEKNGKLFYDTDGKRVSLVPYASGRPVDFSMEVDLKNSEFSLYVNGERVVYAAKLSDPTTKTIHTFTIDGDRQTRLDSLFILDCVPLKDVKMPYSPRVLVDANFSVRSGIKGWERADYDDETWQAVQLPYAHGGVRYAKEDLYLRKTLNVETFEKAILSFETLDPGGEIYVNGIKVATITNR